jgi:hypothetical protein
MFRTFDFPAARGAFAQSGNSGLKLRRHGGLRTFHVKTRHYTPSSTEGDGFLFPCEINALLG